MRYLLCSFGSMGDVLPVVAVAEALSAAGQIATVATAERYRKLVEDRGLGFVAIRPDVALDDAALMKRVMDPRSGSSVVVREILMPSIRESLVDLEAVVDDHDVLVSHTLTYAVPLLCRSRRKPWASLVLSPMCFASAWDPPVLAPIPALARLRKLGPGFNGWLFRQLKKVSHPWSAPLQSLRAQLGVGEYGDPLWEGQHAPQCVLAMFPREFAAPQPDWPPNVVHCGFPLEPPRPMAQDDPARNFLDSGPPPLVFTLGSSAVVADRSFYDIAIAAVRSLGQRAVLVAGPHAAELASDSMGDASILAVSWAHFGSLFPRASLVVHPGGIGTTAEAMRAGTPQFVVPFAHDQFDNAARVVRSGLGRALPRIRCSRGRLARALSELIGNEDIRRAAARRAAHWPACSGQEAAANALVSTFPADRP